MEFEFDEPIVLSSIDGPGLLDNPELSHEESVRIMLDLIDFFEDNMPQKYISVKDLGGLVGQDKVKVGDTYVVRGFNKNWGKVPTTEIVYDVFDDHWADTVITKVGPIPYIKGDEIKRYRYFDEGFRSELPKINLGSHLAKDYLDLLNPQRRQQNA